MDRLLPLHPRAIWRSVLDQPKSFWCACGYLFFEYVRPQSIYTQIDVVAWPVIFLGLTFIFAEQERQKWLPSGGMTLGIAVMAFIVFLSAVFAVNPLLSFRHWRDFFDWIIIYFVVRRAVNTEVKLFLFIGLFFLANLKMTQHGFLSWAMRGFVFASWGVTGGPGWFSNSGEFGIQLCIFIPMLLGVTLALRQYWSATTQVIIGVIFLTGNRRRHCLVIPRRRGGAGRGPPVDGHPQSELHEVLFPDSPGRRSPWPGLSTSTSRMSSWPA